MSTLCGKTRTVSILQTIFFIWYVTSVRWCKLWEVTAILGPQKDILWIDSLLISLGLLCFPLWHTSLHLTHSSHSDPMDVGSNNPVIIFTSNKCFKLVDINRTELEGNEIVGREEETWSTITHGTCFCGLISTYTLTETFQNCVS